MANIRRMRPNDEGAVLQLISELSVSNVESVDGGFLVAEPTPEKIHASDHSYVAENEQGVIGFVLCYSPEAYQTAFGRTLSDAYPGPELDRNAWMGHLIGVRDGHRNQGIGEMLVDSIIRDASEQGVSRIYAELLLRPFNPKMVFHIKRGWEFVGPTRSYEKNGTLAGLVEKKV